MAATDYAVESKVESIANFKHDNRAVVGHLVKLKVGGEELKTDFSFLTHQPQPREFLSQVW